VRGPVRVPVEELEVLLRPLLGVEDRLVEVDGVLEERGRAEEPAVAPAGQEQDGVVELEVLHEPCRPRVVVPDLGVGLDLVGDGGGGEPEPDDHEAAEQEASPALAEPGGPVPQRAGACGAEHDERHDHRQVVEGPERLHARPQAAHGVRAPEREVAEREGEGEPGDRPAGPTGGAPEAEDGEDDEDDPAEGPRREPPEVGHHPVEAVAGAEPDRGLVEDPAPPESERVLRARRLVRERERAAHDVRVVGEGDGEHRGRTEGEQAGRAAHEGAQPLPA
jgi:hypothetical protein